MAATFLVDAAGHWTSPTSVVLIFVVVLPSIFLCLGFLTPYCAAICCLLELHLLSIASGQDRFNLIVSVLTGAVLAVLGPGAYSVDARIFGRRILAVPPRHRPRSD